MDEASPSQSNTATANSVIQPATTQDERRRYRRYALYLDARVTGRGFGPWPSKVRDFCRGGMHIAWDHGSPGNPGTLRRGDPVSVRFQAPEPGRAPDVTLHAIVCRVFEGGIGVAFRECPEDAFEALQRAQEAYVPPEFAPPGEAERHSDRDAAGTWATPRRMSTRIAEIKALYGALVDAHLGPAMNDFFDQAVERLFDCAREARSDAEQRDFFDAMSVLRQQRGRLEPEIAGAVLGWVADGRRAPQETPAGAAAGSRLSLVEDDELEHLLARAELISQVEGRNKTSLYQLGRRFTGLLGVGIDAGNLPVGPEVFAGAFCRALRGLRLKPIQMRTTYKVLEGALLTHLARLYQELNELLAREGILPDLGDGCYLPSRTHAEPPQTEEHQDLVAAAATSAPMSGASDGPIDPPAADPFQLVQSLMALQQGLLRPAGSSREVLQGPGGPAQLSVPREHHGVPCSNTGSIAQLLQELQIQGDHFPEATGSGTVREFPVSQRDGQTAGSRGWFTGAKGDGASDIISSLFDAIDRDPELADAVKSQLRRLQKPICSTAMSDPDFLSRSTHPARRALDQLARLQPLLAQKDDSVGEELKARLDRLMTRITCDGGASEQVFAEAGGELDELLARAERTYSENRARVVDECERQQALLRSRRTGEGSTALSTPEVPPRAMREWGVWLNRAKHLQVGDALLVDQETGSPQRRILAWVGEGFNPFVFVDANGRKAATLTLHELAMQLRQGLATVVMAEPPLLERALHSVVHGLHSEIGRQALHDPVTGLANRKQLLSIMAQAVLQPHPPDRRRLLLYLEIDGVQPLVERFGAGAKDLLLKKLGALLQRWLGKRGVLARVAELAFSILLDACAVQAARDIAAQVQGLIARTTVRCRSEHFKIGASLGVLPLPDGAADPEALLEAVAIAGDTARSADGNRIHAAALPAAGPAIDWGAWLDQCLAMEDIDLYCRHSLPLKPGNGTLPQVEIWPGARFLDRIWIPPQDLEMSQDPAKLLALDRRAIAATLRWMAEHGDRIDRLGACTMRIFTTSLKDEQLLHYVLDQLMESPVPPWKVCFEIGETALDGCYAEVQRLVRTLKEFGCQFCLAGFGMPATGSEYLSKLGMDFLKINGIFVTDMNVNAQDYAVVRSANDIGHLLGMQTIAANITSEATVASLREIGIDFGQGPAVSVVRPISELA